MRALTISIFAAALPLCACASGNVRTAAQYATAPAPAVLHPYYNPYAAYGEANATWRPAVFNQHGTIVNPYEPASQAGRPDYEHSPWATGAQGGSPLAPPGTF